jgi:DNA-binding MurR/RpiR family transcriptional regulator
LTEGQLLRSASVKRKPCGVQLKTVVRISHHCGFAGIHRQRHRACHQLHRAAQYVSRHLLQLSVQQRGL